MAGQNSKRQSKTIRDFGKYKSSLHDGPIGCGKTYCVEEALGLACLNLKNNGIYGDTGKYPGRHIVLTGPSVPVIKRNQCNVLSRLFGADFKYTSSTKDGQKKNAVLFGQYIHLIGLDTIQAYERIRGQSPVWCYIHDEVTFLKDRDLYDLMLGRLGRDSDIEVKQLLKSLGYLDGFYVGSTNPDAPTHWVKKGIDSGLFDDYNHWTMNDAAWDGSKEYYEDLKKRYADRDTYYRRYLLGEWTMAEGMVWNAFTQENIVDISKEDADALYLGGFDRVIIGIDWGSNHNTSFSVLGSNDKNYVVVCNKNYNNLSPSELVVELKKLIRKINESHSIEAIYVDQAGKSYNDELIKNGIDFYNAMKGHEYIPLVNSAFFTKELLVLSTCDELIDEIYGYKYKLNTISDEINRVNDDACDSVRYAYVTDVKNRGIY
jgi:hypothetical protein